MVSNRPRGNLVPDAYLLQVQTMDLRLDRSNPPDEQEYECLCATSARWIYIAMTHLTVRRLSLATIDPIDMLFTARLSFV